MPCKPATYSNSRTENGRCGSRAGARSTGPPLDRRLRELGVTTVVLAGCNYPNCPRAAVYGASERDYRVLIASDAVPGVKPDHLDEAAQMGIVHTPSGEITRRLRCTRPRSAYP
ncbi:MAG TPA: isochorismatase family protein [Aldersonia sp.]